MRVGLALPQYGRFADPAVTLRVAAEAEAMGFDSLWVGDRLLLPTAPRDRYVSRDGVVPTEYENFLDPLTLLAAVAATTSRARLGTSTLNALWQPPALLARTVTTLDQLSGGRIDLGIGAGWSRDEYQAAGVPWAGRGARLEETLDVLDAFWADGHLVAHEGPLWTVPESVVRARPVQRPRPPVLLAGLVPAAFTRVARRADGWLAVGLPLPALTATIASIRKQAGSYGRDPDALRFPLRINPHVTTEKADPAHVPHTGTVGQLADYARTVDGVVDEMFADFQQTAGSVDEYLDLAGELLAALRR
ncbi:LLM class F420-dependent oxidoreductase [Lentzea pudingi]|uniref:LLM class F420-dependent oxidoreductase n=1 Tax=Lentzea pudingi TaxID=1789439 RepID=A0ABQ2H9P1_9PSEU|nr:TIGR03619 family F420-dependent LLM class oxidoreductase [Lentzea pudingi]GGM68449.1 LLM class F420-dependent oxidoreductase [Lentzea pudingi]